MSGIRKRFRRVVVNPSSPNAGIWECSKSMPLEKWAEHFERNGVEAHTIQPLIIEMPFGQQAPVYEVKK